MILIADSGSTKTTWCALNPETRETTFTETSGINPFYLNKKDILTLLKSEYHSSVMNFETIWFYGAGCANESSINRVKEALARFFKSETINVESDLMAAARALCQTQPGIACILGTGSNSCAYNGREITAHVPPLGFILGDEGSGAVIGKRLLADVLKNQLPGHIIEKFFLRYQTSYNEIMENIYRKPSPNRYAAGFVPFIAKHEEEPALDEIIMEAFNQFICRNILQYNHHLELTIHFTGSIAWIFKQKLEKALLKHNLIMGQVVKEPINGLIQYHQKKS